jgi:hypothetical protein
MSITGTVNTQQVIQMSTVTDKLQHTLQQLPVTTGQQIQDEQIVQNDLKKIEIQDPENIEKPSSSNPEGKKRREIRLRIKLTQDGNNEVIPKSIKNTIPKGDPNQGQNINITA